MTTLKRAGIFIVLMATSMASVQAIAATFTATLDKTGKVTAQSPKWIKDVKLTAQPDYFSDYKVRFVPGVFKDAPRFCTVSVTDVSSNDHIFYGHAKLGSVPAINYVNVLTLKVGDNKPAGDSSMGFQLMCVK
ncbi:MULTISPECIES: hypothetical protein [Pseudomonas]|nr:MULTISPECIES: hypothetical protein [Pseudomonas fluorescens group]ETK23639.1 hypothetical protein H096_08842 [Pseudomonas sp. FH1]NWC73923.1 hypothetical protein [Pseudomonas sp. P7759]